MKKEAMTIKNTRKLISDKVTKGMDTVDTIAESPVQPSFSGEPSSPITPVKILTIDIKEK